MKKLEGGVCMYSTILSAACHGIDSYLVNVEVDASTGLPGFDMVGSLASEVKEARERVRVALRNCGIVLPPVHLTVNISPANIRKEGTAYDLPIAVGILVSLGDKELLPHQRFQKQAHYCCCRRSCTQ